MHSWKSTNLDCQLIKIFSEKYLRGRSKLKRENVRDFFGFQFKNTLFPGLFWKSEKHAMRLLDQVILMWHINKNLRNIKQSKHKILVRNVNHLETGYTLLQIPSEPWSAAVLNSVSLDLQPVLNSALNLLQNLFLTPVLKTTLPSTYTHFKQYLDLFGQHTQAIITFVFAIIKTLYYIRIGSTISPFLMMINQMTILTF